MYISKFATRILRSAAQNNLPYDLSEVVQMAVDDLVSDGLLIEQESGTQPYRLTEAGTQFLAA